MELVAQRLTAMGLSGQMIDAILMHAIFPRLSEEVIGATVSSRKLAAAQPDAAGDDFHYECSEAPH